MTFLAKVYACNAAFQLFGAAASFLAPCWPLGVLILGGSAFFVDAAWGCPRAGI